MRACVRACGRAGVARGAPTRMMAALVLPPKPRPSQKPAPSATTFLSAPPGVVWNAAESSATLAEVHGRNAAFLGVPLGPLLGRERRGVLLRSAHRSHTPGELT